MQGNLHKMHTTYANPVEYKLILGDDEICLNKLLNKKIQLKYTGKIHCIQCGRKTSKSFQQGYCFPCMQRLQECNCMVRPENCRFYEGTCDPNDWAHANCAKPHVVYLANSSNLKVGITRVSQMPTRWIDQGATQALAFFRVQNRYQVGIIEVALKAHAKDRTNWRAMLRGKPEPIDLIAERDQILNKANDELAIIIDSYPAGEIELLPDEKPINFSYPVLQYPEKIITLNLDKQSEFNGTLLGIKGQYLIFDIGVINIRKYSGYEVNLNFS